MKRVKLLVEVDVAESVNPKEFADAIEEFLEEELAEYLLDAEEEEEEKKGDDADIPELFVTVQK